MNVALPHLEIFIGNPIFDKCSINTNCQPMVSSVPMLSSVLQISGNWDALQARVTAIKQEQHRHVPRIPPLTSVMRKSVLTSHHSTRKYIRLINCNLRLCLFDMLYFDCDVNNYCLVISTINCTFLYHLPFDLTASVDKHYLRMTNSCSVSNGQ